MELAMSALEERYIEEVNAAVAEDRMDLVEELNDEYLDASLRLLLEDD
jgi:uncharacterized coiled-coil protein SlyX